MGLLGLVFDSSALLVSIFLVGTVALIIISIWVSLELMARQVMLTKMKVFIACILTSIIFCYNLGAFHGTSWRLCLFSE